MKRYDMQVNVPHSAYGACDYFMPNIMREWVHGLDLDYLYAGNSSSGDGFTNGVSNKMSHYMVNDIQRGDSIAFQIQFPHAKVHLLEQ